MSDPEVLEGGPRRGRLLAVPAAQTPWEELQKEC
jgi:hypothetical protein